MSYLKDVLYSASKTFHEEELISNFVEKNKNDFVTEADLKVEKIIINELQAKYPEIKMLSEETHAAVDYKTNYWILDPIDGTTNLIHGYRQSAISLAYCEKGKPVIGIIYQPFRDEMFTAEIGKGAYLNGVPIHVSGCSCLNDCLAIIGTNPYHKGSSSVEFEMFKQTFDYCQDIRRSGSAAIDLVNIAAGRADLFFEKNLKPWDYAAGFVLVCEAGGNVSDFFGHPINACISNEDIFASNGLIDGEFRCKVLNNIDTQNNNI